MTDLAYDVVTAVLVVGWFVAFYLFCLRQERRK